MSSTTFWILYGIVGLVVGYFFARHAYKPGPLPRKYNEIPAENVGWALGMWIVYGLAWPGVAVVLLTVFIVAFFPGKRYIKSGANRLFGMKNNG